MLRGRGHAAVTNTCKEESMPQQSKKELRQEMKVVLANLDKRWASKAHTEVCAQLARLVATETAAASVRHILAWIPCFPGEVDLSGFIGEMLKTSYVYLPRVDERNTMSFVRISDNWAAHLESGVRGIRQPFADYGEPFDPEDGGSVVVVAPGLAFDSQGRRLGRGGGHYDRFLDTPRLAGALRIGVCWSMQVLREIPTDPHDVNMNWLTHERGVIHLPTGML
jgi:5-formyltetrahydrofolate cyclo-ligase